LNFKNIIKIKINSKVIILYFPKLTDYAKENYSECVLFILFVVFVSIITYYRFNVQLEIGPAWDAYDFLANAAEFAGTSVNYTDPLRPPLLSFLTSLYFRFGGLYEGAIFIVDGILFVLGAIGLYLLFKLRFQAIYSFIGALIYVTSPLILSLICGGWSDVSSCSFIIWGIYFLIRATKENSKYFYLSFPLFMMAFLSRYAVALIIFPISLYLSIELKNNSKQYNDLLIGLLVSFLILMPVFIFFQLKFGNFLYPFVDSFGTSKGSDLTLWFAYNPDKLFFIKNMPYYMGNTAIAVTFISLVGFAVIVVRKISLIPKKLKMGLKNLNLHIKLKLVLILILIGLLIISFGIVNYIVSIMIFTVLCYLFYQVSFRGGNDQLSMDFLILIWFGTFLIFSSVYAAKVDRYFVMMVPPICYFLLMGLKTTINQVGVKYKNINITLVVFSFFLVLIMLISTFSYIQGVAGENTDSKVINDNVISMSQWIKEYDPSYKDKIVYADYWPYFGWYLQMDVKKMPIFRDNQVIYAESKDHNFTAEDNFAFNQELESNNVFYYLCSHPKLNLTNYKLIKECGTIRLYEKMV